MSPSDNATNVSVTSNIVLTFNEAVKAGSGTINIYNSATTALVGSISVADPTQVTFSGNQLIIDPLFNFAQTTGYYVTLAAGVVLDLANNPFAGISSSTAFNFATGSGYDTVAPQLISSSPADNANGVDVGTNIVLTFDEPVKPWGNLLIINAGDGQAVQNISFWDQTQVTFAGNQVIINPSADLAVGSGYYLSIGSNAIHDLSGNPFAGISSPTTLNFTTASPPNPPPTNLVKSGSELLANTTTDGQQHDPAVTALADGRFVITWSDFSSSPDDAGGSVRGQIFNTNGTKSGAEFRVNTTTAGIQTGPVITALSDGGFVVVWTSINGLEVMAQIYGADGNKSGSEFKINAGGNQVYPVVTALADGGFVVAWQDSSGSLDGSGYGVHAQIFDGDGSTVGSEFLANTHTIGNQQYPAITALADGGFAIAWIDTVGSAAVWTQVFDDNGNKVEGVRLVSTVISGQDGASVVGLADGRFVVFWKVLGSTATVYGKLYNADGTTPGTTFVVSDKAISDAGSPTPDLVGALDDGRFVIAWTDWSQTGADTSNEGIRAQIYNPDGTKSGSELVVNTTVAGAQFRPSLSVLPGDNIVIAWSDLSQTGGDTSETAVRAQVLAHQAVGGLVLTGTATGNVLTGGALNDTIAGLGRADTLTGAGGIDTFVYHAVADSTSRNFDTITDFDASADRLDLWYQVTGVDPSITTGSVGTRTFDANLASAVGAARLAAHHAVLFTPSAGAHLGKTFLIVDANGVAGYQAGADLVILLGAASNLSGLTSSDFV
jgi:methionine-rich copper-binding protein CopC